MRREFLTPPELPEASECRTLTIPSSKEWLGIFNSALLDATYAYNFEQVNDTDLTPEATAEICRQIFASYLESECGGGECETPEMPEGGRIFRVGLAGRFQELQGGEWIDPTGDAELPPPDARVGGTPDDQTCLAAKNAANVLEQFYEQALDDYQDSIDTAAAIASQAGLAGTVVLAALGIVTYGVAFVIYGVFSLFYAALEFLTEDMWNAAFTEKLVCILIECSTNDGGVVTFDYDQFMTHLANSVDITDNANELRLFGQLWYMLQWVGSQGLDLAGRTTAISDDDCSYCDCALYEDAMFASAGALTYPNGRNGIASPWGTTTNAGNWQAAGGRTGGGCFNSANIGNFGSPAQAKRESIVIVDLGANYTVSYARMYYTMAGSGASTIAIRMWNNAGTPVAYFPQAGVFNAWTLKEYTGTPVANVRYVQFFTDANNATSSAHFIDDIMVEYC